MHAAQRIRSVLDHEIETGLSKVPPQPQPYDPAAGVNSLPSYEVHISPAPKDELRALGGGGPDFYISKNQLLKAIILDLWNTPTTRISFPEDLDERNYDVTARIPVADRGLLRKVVQDAVERLRVERETRIQQVYLATATQTPSSQLQPAREDDASMSGGGQGSIIGTGQAMQEIAHAIEDLLNVPVLDETGFRGKYNYSASSKLPPPEAPFDFAHQLGLKLTPADRPIEMLIVRKLGE